MWERYIGLALGLALLAGCSSKEPLAVERIGSSRHHLVGVPDNGYPNYHERAMLTAINRARADPMVLDETMASCGNSKVPRAPLMRSQSGSRCARFHCASCIINDGGLSHNSYCDVASNIGSTFESSCDGSASCACSGNEHFTCTTLGGSGTGPSTRCSNFGFSYAGEVGAAGYSNGWSAVWGWMSECPPATGHRDILTMDRTQIGLGYYTGSTACWSRLYFGDLSNSPTTIYTLPAGVHRPETGASQDFYVNYYDPNGGPNTINVVVDGVCHAMSLEIGSASNGTFHTNVNVGSGCHQYWFLAFDGSNERKAYPEIGAWGVGSCTDYDQNALAADCENCTNGQTQPCGIGQCAGTQACSSGNWGACNGPPPDASESCDGVDNDCDGNLPANESDPDNDGYYGCADDCDDGNGDVHPGAAEQCDGEDNDCDGNVPAEEADGDSDGYLACADDCNDGNAAVNPGATELCNGLDDDCSGAPGADEVDGDSDGYMVCENDCDDGNGSIHPGVVELCNGIDDDCTGTPAANEVDGDGDGFMLCDLDCDDGNDSVYPGATEQCNDIDDDCDGGVDEGCPCSDDGGTKQCGSDVGACELGSQSCSGGVWGDCLGGVQPSQEQCNGLDDDCDDVLPDAEVDGDDDGHLLCANDCQDDNPDVHPGAPDLCNGIDDDCDDITDEDCGCTPGDSQACGTAEGECEPGSQSCDNGIWSECLGGVQPGEEICDGLDNNCDGVIDEGCAGGAGAADEEDDGDCGCRHPGAPAGWPALLLLFGLPLLRRRLR